MHLDTERPCSRPKNGVFSRILAIFRDFSDFVRKHENCVVMLKNKDAIEDYYVLMHSERANFKNKK